MFEHLRAHLARPTFFLAAGIAIGALLAPSAGGGGAQAVTTYTRAVSCPGLAWQPVNSDQIYDSVGTIRRAFNTGYYVCAVDLPHKAVVTRVRFSVLDANYNGNVNSCALVRAGLAIETTNTAQLMAAVGTTTDSYDSQRLSDTTISFATIDNMNFGYYLQCQIVGSGWIAVGVYGADITYKITAANG